jgi:hypothetical protein
VGFTGRRDATSYKGDSDEARRIFGVEGLFRARQSVSEVFGEM